MIDGYAHLGMPRFWALEDYQQIMKLVGITKAMVCPFRFLPGHRGDPSRHRSRTRSVPRLRSGPRP